MLGGVFGVAIGVEADITAVSVLVKHLHQQAIIFLRPVRPGLNSIRDLSFAMAQKQNWRGYRSRLAMSYDTSLPP